MFIQLKISQITVNIVQTVMEAKTDYVWTRKKWLQGLSASFAGRIPGTARSPEHCQELSDSEHGWVWTPNPHLSPKQTDRKQTTLKARHWNQLLSLGWREFYFTLQFTNMTASAPGLMLINNAAGEVPSSVTRQQQKLSFSERSILTGFQFLIAKYSVLFMSHSTRKNVTVTSLAVWLIKLLSNKTSISYFFQRTLEKQQYLLSHSQTDGLGYP